MDNVFYFHGETEPLGVPVVEQDSVEAVQHYQRRHEGMVLKNPRAVSIMGFGVDHGLGAHAGNGPKWRTTVVAVLRLDYLKGAPITYARLEGEEATELLADLAHAVAIRGRKV